MLVATWTLLIRRTYKSRCTIFSARVHESILSISATKLRYCNDFQVYRCSLNYWPDWKLIDFYRGDSLINILRFKISRSVNKEAVIVPHKLLPLELHGFLLISRWKIKSIWNCVRSRLQTNEKNIKFEKLHKTDFKLFDREDSQKFATRFTVAFNEKCKKWRRRKKRRREKEQEHNTLCKIGIASTVHFFSLILPRRTHFYHRRLFPFRRNSIRWESIANSLCKSKNIPHWIFDGILKSFRCSPSRSLIELEFRSLTNVVPALISQSPFHNLRYNRALRAVNKPPPIVRNPSGNFLCPRRRLYYKLVYARQID